MYNNNSLPSIICFSSFSLFSDFSTEVNNTYDLTMFTSFLAVLVCIFN